MALDFSRVAAAALAQAETLCQSWIGGKRSGHEWTGERRANGGLGDSWTCNLNTGAWLHGAGDERGGDLISLYAALNHLTQLAALEVVAALVGVTNGAAGPPAIRAVEDPAGHAPPDAELPVADAVYRYLNAAGELVLVVCRYDEAGTESGTKAGKRFAQFTWRRGRWSPRGLPAPRPLYGLPELSIRPDDPVLVVEGEKCHAAASALLGAYVCVTWAGGAQSVKTADWSPLTGRDVLLWPDADDAGRDAMITLAGLLAPIAKRVRIVKTDGQPDGWDLADAVADGWDAKKITRWARDRVTEVGAPSEKAPPKRPSQPTAPSEPSTLVTVRNLGFVLDHRERPVLNLVNVSLVLQKHQGFMNHIWYDTFRQTVCHDFGGGERAWDDTQNRRLTTTLQQSGLGLEKLTSKLCIEAVYHAAELRSRNGVTTWLESLQWDGTERLATWLADFFGAPQDEVRSAIGTNWLVMMVRRAYEPGCQCDYVIVLEGEQGIYKSSVLEDLAAPWFASLSQKFGSKEFNEALRGIWLIEIPDLSSFVGRDHQQIIGAITRRSDVYRVPYDRLTSEHPRQCVICVSTEEPSEYLADTFGIRRFWPVPCTEINRGAIRAVREQLFAEAVALYRSGHGGYEVPDSLKLEQLNRVERDIYHDKLVAWLSGRTTASNLDIYENVFAQLDQFGRVSRTAEPKDSKRITRAMRRVGWIRSRVSADRGWRKKF